MALLQSDDQNAVLACLTWAYLNWRTLDMKKSPENIAWKFKGNLYTISSDQQPGWAKNSQKKKGYEGI